MSCIYLQAVRVQTEMWVELILNWILLPQTSVTGHLSGILAGYLYYEWRTLRFDTAEEAEYPQLLCSRRSRTCLSRT